MNRFIQAFCLLSFLMLAALGCSSRTPGTSYQAHISTKLSIGNQELVRSAFLEWQEKTNVRFEIMVSDEKCGDQCISVGPGSISTLHRVGETDRFEDEDRGEIVLDLDKIHDNQRLLYGTIAHEIGHGMGLEHDERKGTLMYPTQDGNPLHVVCWDVAQYYSLRGQNHDCP